MSWIPSRSDFDSTQDQILTDILLDTNDSWWLQGYAGTGKTMLLIHLISEYMEAGWDCAFVTFTHALKKLAIEAMKELGHSSSRINVETVDKLNSLNNTYDIIFVDEVQDLTAKQISKLMSLGKRFVYAGDINQSIYLQAASNSSISRLLGRPTIVELTDLYRMPQPVFLAANITYPAAQIALGAQVSVNNNSTINIVQARSLSREVEWVYDQALAESRSKLPSAILFGTHDSLQKYVLTLVNHLGLTNYPGVVGNDYGPMNEYLQKKRIKLMYFGGANGGDLSSADSSRMVLLMTMHSAKGLEFGSVFTPFMNDDYSLCPYPSMKNNEDWQSRFLFMAITRTKQNYYASYTKTLNALLLSLHPVNVTPTLKNNGMANLASYFKTSRV